MPVAEKITSRKEYQQRINRVLDHIYDHLGDDLSLGRLARVANFSEFHFHRIFRSLMGEPLNEFITRQRLEKALKLLRRDSKPDLTEIAVECGFNSLSNFSRTFKKHYEISPSQVEIEEFLKKSKIGQTYPIESRYYLQGFPEDELNLDFPVTIRRFDDLRLAYIRCFGLYLDPQKGMDAYARLMAWARRNGRMTPETLLIGMSPDDPEITPLEKCRYDFCLTVDPAVKADGEVCVMTLPACDFAVHYCAGELQKFDQAWNYFFKIWLPSSGYEPADRPAMEIFYSRPEEIGWERFEIDCCIPISSF
jgi:DNA gyrase inhibitor GyrI/AraC-like DNA-binding protein